MSSAFDVWINAFCGVLDNDVDDFFAIGEDNEEIWAVGTKSV